MQEIRFNPSVEPTVGVEIEAQLVDKDSGNLVNFRFVNHLESSKLVE